MSGKIDSALISLLRITLATICEHYVGGGETLETFPSRLFILKPLCSAEHVQEFEYCGRNALQLLNLRKVDSAYISLPKITPATICEHHGDRRPSGNLPKPACFILKRLCSAEHVREFEYCGRGALQLLNLCFTLSKTRT